MQYLNFDVQIGQGAGREYPVTVRSQAGETQVTMRFPFDELALRDASKDLQIALLHSSGVRRQSLAPEAKTVQGFGQSLFDALLAGEVRALYDVARREAGQKGMGVRLRLMIQAPELAALPWEYLFDARQGAYICLSRNTPVVRYLEAAQPIQPLAVTPPLRMLVMIASPSDQDALDIQRERRRLEEALRGLEPQGLLKLRWLQGQTWRDILQAMQRGPWHIFHFIGHGGYDERRDEGVLALANEQGRTQLLTATQLGTLLADHFPLRLVVLNACEGAKGSTDDLFSSTSATLARRGLPAVLAMQYEISDAAAIEFTRTFYETVAYGKPVDEAASEARKAIGLGNANTLEWGTPVLYLRSPDGRLFDMPERTEMTMTGALVPPSGSSADLPAIFPPPMAPQTPPPDAGRSLPSGQPSYQATPQQQYPASGVGPAPSQPAPSPVTPVLPLYQSPPPPQRGRDLPPATGDAEDIAQVFYVPPQREPAQPSLPQQYPASTPGPAPSQPAPSPAQPQSQGWSLYQPAQPPVTPDRPLYQAPPPPQPMPPAPQQYRASAPGPAPSQPASSPVTPPLGTPSPKERRKRGPGLLVGVLLAVVLVAGGLIAAFALLGRQHGPTTASTSGATTTQVSVAQTPTPNPVLYQASLTSDPGGWNCNPTPSACSFQSDGYHITAPNNPSDTWSQLTTKTFDHMVLKVHAVIIGGSASSTDDRLEITFRANGASFYDFALYTDGTYEVPAFNGTSGTDLVPRTSSSAIAQGFNHPYDLEIDVNGSSFTFFVNGTFLTNTSDPNNSISSGIVSLDAYNYSTEVVYSNLTITTP